MRVRSVDRTVRLGLDRQSGFGWIGMDFHMGTSQLAEATTNALGGPLKAVIEASFPPPAEAAGKE